MLALRGADCDAIEGAYMNAIADIASGPCNCYDEEIVLTRMFDKAELKDMVKPHYRSQDAGGALDVISLRGDGWEDC